MGRETPARRCAPRCGFASNHAIFSCWSPRLGASQRGRIGCRRNQLFFSLLLPSLSLSLSHIQTNFLLPTRSQHLWVSRAIATSTRALPPLLQVQESQSLRVVLLLVRRHLVRRLGRGGLLLPSAQRKAKWMKYMSAKLRFNKWHKLRYMMAAFLFVVVRKGLWNRDFD